MVQRKVPTKLVLKTDETQHDLKNNKGADLKKMMKKSGSIKRPKHPGKPPPPSGKAPTTPNYMKPTTSSDARKERSQSPVSDRNSSILRRKSSDCLKHGVSSGKKATKSLLGRTLTKSPSFKPSRSSARRCSTVVLCENLDAQKATCSSTLKDCKFPAYLSLNHGGTESEGTSAVKVCPYTYCSLNGHHHAPLPPLKSFLSARRRTIKTQRSVKLECLSPREAKPVAEDEYKNFFVEICVKKDEDAVSGEDQEQSVFATLSDAPIYDDSEASEGYESSLHLDYDYEYKPATDMEPDPEADGEEFIVYSDGKDCGFDEVSQESYDESINSDAFSSSDDGESTDHVEEHSESAAADDDKHILSETSFNNTSHESLPNEDAIAATEDHSEGVPLNSSEGDDIQDDLRPETDETAQARVTAKSKKPVQESDDDDFRPETEETAWALVIAKSKKPVQESDDLGCFNPRGPNFLPLEPEPDGEKVDLRHQDLDERRNSEEWMVDYALRQVVTKLGPARKKKVALLVEAFEKVMPTTKCDVQLMHSSGFDHARPMQACI